MEAAKPHVTRPRNTDAQAISTRTGMASVKASAHAKPEAEGIVLVGGKGGRARSGGGRGKGKGYGQGQGAGKKGQGRGSKNGACREVSRCMLPFSTVTSKKGDIAAPVPPARMAAIYDENMRVANLNVEWLNLAISGIDLRTIMKAHSTATPCVPSAAVAAVETIIAMHKDLNIRVNDIAAELKEMSDTLHVDVRAFRDRSGKAITLDDVDTLRALMAEGNLMFSGVNLMQILKNQNATFKAAIIDKKMEPEQWFSGLKYCEEENSFAVVYRVAGGDIDVVFTTGYAGQALSPDPKPHGSLQHNIVLLDNYEAPSMNANATSRRLSMI